MSFYIAKAPAGQTAAEFDGDGKVWSKIYQDHPTLGGTMVWPSQGKLRTRFLSFAADMDLSRRVLTT